MSFFGRIVSELGFVRRLPLFTPAPPPIATWGIELTVSVSTVMLRVDPSPTALPRPAGRTVANDFGAGATFGRAGCVTGTVVDRILTSFLPALSLPLSATAEAGADFNEALNAESIGFSCSLILDNFPSSVFCCDPS